MGQKAKFLRDQHVSAFASKAAQTAQPNFGTSAILPRAHLPRNKTIARLRTS